MKIREPSHAEALRASLQPEFPLWAFCPTDKIHLPTAERNCRSDLQCQVLPQATERPGFVPPEKPQAPLRPFPLTLFPPWPPCSLKSARSAAHLPCWHGHKADPPHHGPEELPGQMAL